MRLLSHNPCLKAYLYFSKLLLYYVEAWSFQCQDLIVKYFIFNSEICTVFLLQSSERDVVQDAA